MWEVSLIILRKLQCCIPDPNASSTEVVGLSVEVLWK